MKPETPLPDKNLKNYLVLINCVWINYDETLVIAYMEIPQGNSTYSVSFE